MHVLVFVGIAAAYLSSFFPLCSLGYIRYQNGKVKELSISVNVIQKVHVF